MGPIARFGIAARRGFGRITPDPFVLAVGLSALVMLFALFLGNDGAQGVTDLPRAFVTTLGYWNAEGGLWNLLRFAMQATLMLVLGTAFAEAPLIRDAIVNFAAAPRSPRQLVAATAFVAIALGLFNWSLSLIGGALLAREAGKVAKQRGWKLHYPLLCAAAYAGLMVWHGGLSGTAPLKVTTELDLQKILGEDLAEAVGVIGLGRTLFSPMNLIVSAGLLVLGPLVFGALTPKQGEDPDPMSAPEDEAAAERDSDTPPADWVESVERSPLITWLLAFPMLVALGTWLGTTGLTKLDLNTVNLFLFCGALVLHGRPDRFLAACGRGVRGATGILLQFPLYAGIMGMMSGSGLSARLTDMVAGAGAGALGVVTFLSAGLVNLFVPSGGGQWAVQGPIISQAALDAGVPVEHVLMAMAYGDQWTNMLQPFWALPLLAITGVRARDIVGYCAIWMLVGGAWFIASLLLFV